MRVVPPLGPPVQLHKYVNSPPSLSPPGLSALVSPGTEFLLTEMEHCSQIHSTEGHRLLGEGIL